MTRAMKFRYKLRDGYYNVKIFIKNLPFFLKQAWVWRSWDSAFTIDSFVAMLELVGEDLAKDRWHKGANKHSIRCKYAAHLLKKAYGKSLISYDKSYLNWSINNKLKFVNNPNYKKMCWERKYPEEYSMKMSTIIHRRVDKWEADRKEFAWKYIHKHIERWWS